MRKQRSKVINQKSQNFLGGKVREDAIYKIYSSCRFCGSITGYKMPIVQNIVPIDVTEVELKTKIQECLQIVVHDGDMMPPLICESCADRICDFFDFQVMCKERNNWVRVKLGLGPMSASKKVVIDASDNELKSPIVKIEKRKAREKVFVIKTEEVKTDKKEISKIKKETRAERELRELLSSNNNLFTSQRSRCRNRDERPLLKELVLPKRLKSGNKSENTKNKKEPQVRPGPASSKLKRFMDVVPVKSKRMKISEQTQKRNMQMCPICNMEFPKGISYNNHFRIHQRITASVEADNSAEEKEIVGTCSKCGKPFEVYRTFRKHQAACRGGKKKLPAKRKQTPPVQVRIVRCDSLLNVNDNGHYDVSDVRCPYGLDRSCLYPYNKHNSLLCYNRMVDIQFTEIPDAFDIGDTEVVHWDSDNEGERKVENLSTLSLKVIFSDKFLGKVPKRRKVKPFDDFKLTIDRIICNLDVADESKPDNIDNWSDNVSDSILTNDKDDTYSFIGEFNDDSCNANKSNGVRMCKTSASMDDDDEVCDDSNKEICTNDQDSDKITHNRDVISNDINDTVKSGIELLEIEILSDNEDRADQLVENDNRAVSDEIVSESVKKPCDSVGVSEEFAPRVWDSCEIPNEMPITEEIDINTDTNDNEKEDADDQRDDVTSVLCNDTNVEISIQNCFSLSEGSVFHNAKPDIVESNGFDGNCMDDDGIYDDLIERRSDDGNDDEFRSETRSHMNSVEDVSDNDNMETNNISDDLMANKSMDLESISDGEFTIDD